MCLIISRNHFSSSNNPVEIKRIMGNAYASGNTFIGGADKKPFWGISLDEAIEKLTSSTSEIVVEFRRPSPAADSELIYPVPFYVKEDGIYGHYFQNGSVRGIDQNQPQRICQMLSQISKKQHKSLLEAFSVRTRIAIKIGDDITLYGPKYAETSSYHWQDVGDYTISNGEYI